MRLLLFLLFVCNFAFGQEFRNEEFYLKDTFVVEGKKQIYKTRIESPKQIQEYINRYPDYDSLAYLDFVSVFAMDSINQWRKSQGLDTVIFNSEIMYELVDDCIFEHIDEVKKPVLVKTVFNDVCGCEECYRDLVSEIFEHADVMKRLKSSSLDNFNIAIFYVQKIDNYIFCIETQKSIFYVKTYIR